jgi:hypothetical protein
MRFFLVKRPRTILGIFPAEIVVVAFAALAVALANKFDALLFHPFRLYRERIIGLLPLYITAMLLLFLIIRLRMIKKGRLENPGDYPAFGATWLFFREHALERSKVIRDLRFLHLSCACFVVFISLKHLVPVISSRNFDGFLSTLEKRWFGGELLGVTMTKALGTQIAPLVSSGYLLFYPYVAILIFLMMLQSDEVLAHRFFFGFVTLWFFGILLVYAVPTWGPIFHEPRLFSHLPDTDVSAMQERLWQGKLYVDKNPRTAGMPFLISGFPSLHFAVTVLGTLFLARVGRWLFAASATFAAITFVSTLYFGWHYLVDDLAGAALAVYCFILSQKTIQSALFYTDDDSGQY